MSIGVIDIVGNCTHSAKIRIFNGGDGLVDSAGYNLRIRTPWA